MKAADTPTWDYRRAIVLGLAATVGGLLLYLLGAFDFVDLKLLDLSFRLRPPRQANPAIAIVALDDTSLAGAPRTTPLPRDYLARLITAVSRGGPAAIVLDVLLDQAGAAPGEDAALIRALAGSGRVLLPAAAAPTATGTVRPCLPRAEFARVALAVGTVSLRESAADGIVRRFETRRPATAPQALPEATLPGLAAAALRTPNSGQEALIRSARESVPARDGDVRYVDYAGPPGTFYATPARQVLQEPATALLLRDRIVLIGSTAAASGDFLRGPLNRGDPPDNLMPGVEVLANCIDSLLVARPLRPVSPLATPLAMLAGAILLPVLLVRLPSVWGFLSSAVLVVGALALTPVLFVVAGMHWPGGGLAAGLLMVGGTVACDRHFRALARARTIREAFSRYLAPSIVDQLAASGELPALGGHLQPVSVMFCDMHGFTAISRQLPPEQLVAMLSAFFEAMSEPILAEGGFLDKLVGDQIMALFGLPGVRDDDPVRAARAALRMRVALPRFNDRAERHGWPTVTVSIGIHCGEAVVGNVGFRRRMDYTAMGDVVVLAQRLQSSCSDFGADILISAAMVRALGDGFVTRLVGTQQPKGWGDTVAMHTLVGEHGGEAEPADDREGMS